MNRPHVTGMTDHVGAPVEVSQTFNESVRVEDGYLVAGTADWHEFNSTQPAHWTRRLTPAQSAAEALRLRAVIAENRIAAEAAGLHSAVGAL